MLRLERTSCAFALALLMPALCTNGCVVWQSEDPPTVVEVGGNADVSAREIRYRYEFEGTKQVAITNAREQGVKQQVKATLEEAGYTVAEGSGAPRIQVEVTNNEQGSKVLAVLCGLTLLIIPAYGENVITVKGSLWLDADKVATSEASAAVATVMQFFMIFALPFNDYDLTHDTIRRLTLKVVHDLKAKAQELAPQQSAPAPAEAEPAPAGEGLFGAEER
jgi:hypothetical protein